MTSTPLSLVVLRLEGDPSPASGMPCPACQEGLTLHQPDPQSPDRLLGTCRECRGWFLIDTTAGLMVRLPGDHEVRGG